MSGATGMQMMELAAEIGDGVVLNYMVGPDYNKTGHGGDSPPGRTRAGPLASTTSTGPSWWCARSTRTATWPSTGRASC